MFTHIRLQQILVALIVGFAGLSAATAVNAQEKFSVDYRRTTWKTLHFKDAKKAQLHYDTVKYLGCEAKKDAHGDHIDVTYRCTTWRTISLKTHDAAHEWERWLKASGFETKHEH